VGHLADPDHAPLRATLSLFGLYTCHDPATY